MLIIKYLSDWSDFSRIVTAITEIIEDNHSCALSKLNIVILIQIHSINRCVNTRYNFEFEDDAIQKCDNL